MNVFVATKIGQGMRNNDFSFVPEGELVRFGLTCDGGSVDDACGCSRSMTGMSCHKATTTVLIVDKDITRERYFDAIRKSFKSAGWAGLMSKKELDNTVKEEGDELLGLASGLKKDVVYEIRGDRIVARGPADSLRDVTEYNPPIPARKARKTTRKSRKTPAVRSQLKGVK